MMKKLRIAALALALSPVLLLGACGEDAPVKKEMIRPVKAVKVGDSEGLNRRWFPGRAKATVEANLAFEVSGRMISRPIKVGDKVKKGKLLSALDPSDFQNGLDQARAEQRRSLAHRDRVKQAAAKGAVSKQELTDAEAKFEIAQAEVKIRAKALRDSRLHAPFTGTVAATYVENFENVRAKQAILRLLDTTKIEMIIAIPENLISYAPQVKDVRIRFDAIPGREFPAKIKEVSNEASETTRTYPVTLIMDQPDDVKILPGMAGAARGEGKIPGATAQQGVGIPISAVFTEGKEGASYVWVIDANTKKVARRQVKTGELTDFGILVNDGLKPGEWIAIAGAHYLREGQQVRLLTNGG